MNKILITLFLSTIFTTICYSQAVRLIDMFSENEEFITIDRKKEFVDFKLKDSIIFTAKYNSMIMLNRGLASDERLLIKRGSFFYDFKLYKSIGKGSLKIGVYYFNDDKTDLLMINEQYTKILTNNSISYEGTPKAIEFVNDTEIFLVIEFNNKIKFMLLKDINGEMKKILLKTKIKLKNL